VRAAQAQQRYRAKRKAQFEAMQGAVGDLARQVKSLEQERKRRHAAEAELARLKAAGGGAAPRARSLPRGAVPASRAGLDRAAAPPRPGATPAAPPAPATPAIAPDALGDTLAELHLALHAFAAAYALAAAPADGAGLPPLAAEQLTALVQVGAQLLTQLQQASGPAAAALGGSADGGQSTLADAPAHWSRVLSHVGLWPHQLSAVRDWRRTFLAHMTACYARRTALKVRLAGGAGAEEEEEGPRVARSASEGALLLAAAALGYAEPAGAAAALGGVVAALAANLEEERAGACGAMQHLLLHVFTPVQAARYLLAAHPFAWNGLAFAHAAAEGGAP
jgi:hypothetical protein